MRSTRRRWNAVRSRVTCTTVLCRTSPGSPIPCPPRARQNVGNGQAKLLEDSAGAVRESIKALRSLLVEIYPPNLQEEGLEAALSELLVRTVGQGVTTELDVSVLHAPLSPPVAALVYRAAQEGLRNAVEPRVHVTNVIVRAGTDSDRAVLEVQDNGQGFHSDTTTTKAEEGHVGLKRIAGLASDVGGALQVRRRLGGSGPPPGRDRAARSFPALSVFWTRWVALHRERSGANHRRDRNPPALPALTYPKDGRNARVALPHSAKIWARVIDAEPEGHRPEWERTCDG